MTYRLDIILRQEDEWPKWFHNYLNENNVWGIANVQQHLLDNHNCQYLHIPGKREHWLEFKNEQDAVMFLLRWL